MQYDFCTSSVIAFGWGRRCELGRLLSPLGRRAWVLAGARALAADGALEPLWSSLESAGVACEQVPSPAGEPTIDDVDRLVAEVLARGAAAGDVVLAIGGGSVIDRAKAVAGLVTQPDRASVREYLEGIGSGKTLVAPPLPIAAVPTTGGTGSEVTRNAVIACSDPPVKKSLRAAGLIPRVVVVDPELALSVPSDVTASTGLDAITQCLESFVSRKAQPVAQALAVEGLRHAFDALPEAVADGTNRAAREAMAHAALLSGMALANSGLGLAHGVAAALGAIVNVPHGLACAVMLPVAMRVNLPHCTVAMATLARRLVMPVSQIDDGSAASYLVERVEKLCHQLNVPRRLSALEVKPEQLDALVDGSWGNSMQGNPWQPTPAELRAILQAQL